MNKRSKTRKYLKRCGGNGEKNISKWDISLIGDNFITYTHPKYLKLSKHSHCTHWANGDIHCKYNKGSRKCGTFNTVYECTNKTAHRMYVDYLNYYNNK